MPRGVKGSASSKTSKTATKARATKTKETTQAKKTAEEKELETRLEDITAEDVNETTEVEVEEDIEEEELEEVEEDGTKVSVKITTSKDAGNDVQTGSSKWTEQNQKDLKAFKALPEARQKYYESLTANVLKKDEYVKSGSFVFDAILSDGQGIPLGSFIEITSPAGIGKSSLLLYTCRCLCEAGHRCAYIDTERGLNARQLDSFGLTNHVKSGMFIPTTIDTFEEIDEFLVNALEDKTLKFIVIDSLTQASPKDMIEKTMGESQTMAIHARTVSQFLRRFRSMYGNSDKTIFFVAQNRKQFTMYGAQDGAAGGEAQKHAVDIIVKLAPKDKLKKKVKGFNDDVIYGSNCIIKTEKNRHCSPFIPMMITIIFGKGVSNASALYDALVSNEKIRQKGSFYYIEDVNGNEEQIKGKEAVLSYIAQHHEYYIDLVNRLGGIKLPKVS